MHVSKVQGATGRDSASFTSFREILDGKVQQWSFVDVIGVVIDCQAPVPTRKTDWKCTVHMIDTSIHDAAHEVVICHMFMPEEQMPHVKSGDVIVLRRVKVQSRLGDISLLTHFDTKFSHFEAAKIPKPPADPSVALVKSHQKRQGQLSKADLGTVSRLYQEIDKDRIPTIERYEIQIAQSTKVRDKFRELKDVADGCFCDTIVEIVKEPYDSGDKITLWVSDYTENSQFYNHLPPVTKNSDHQDGDPYGYVAKFNKKSSEGEKKPEQGPFGKRSMQITCWDPHVTAIRHGKLTKGTWVSIKNLQVKFGRNVANLEGYLREDRGAHGTKLGIFALDTTDRESMDDRHVAALKRHREYNRHRKSQLKEIEEAAHAGQKRKATTAAQDEQPANSKSKRAAKRKAQREKAAAQEAANKTVPEVEPARPVAHRSDPVELEPVEPAPVPRAPAANLNTNVKCENRNSIPNTVSEVLENLCAEAEINGELISVPLPFVNRNHRVDVRITDFQPSKLEDFVYPKKTSKYAALSDNEGSDLDSEPDHDIDDDDDGDATAREWEWQFALELEDATLDASEPKKFWIVVDNQAAQCLTNLDASDLKHDVDNLEKLRERMFHLWGDLEEKKVARDAQRAKAKRLTRSDQPPPHSDDENEETAEVKIMNRPFPCCVRQYGIKVRETNPGKADAGKGLRWQRVFGLYGTRIAGV